MIGRWPVEQLDTLNTQSVNKYEKINYEFLKSEWYTMIKISFRLNITENFSSGVLGLITVQSKNNILIFFP